MTRVITAFERRTNYAGGHVVAATGSRDMVGTAVSALAEVVELLDNQVEFAIL